MGQKGKGKERCNDDLRNTDFKSGTVSGAHMCYISHLFLKTSLLKVIYATVSGIIEK